MLIEQGPRGDRRGRSEPKARASWSEDFGVRTACGWVQYKFGIDARSGRGRQAWTPSAFKQLVREKAAQAYDERETEYPVMAGLYHFTTAGRAAARSGSTATALVGLGPRAVRRRAGRRRPEEQAARRNSRPCWSSTAGRSRQQANAALDEVHAQVDKLFGDGRPPTRRPAWPAAATAR